MLLKGDVRNLWHQTTRWRSPDGDGRDALDFYSANGSMEDVSEAVLKSVSQRQTWSPLSEESSPNKKSPMTSGQVWKGFFPESTKLHSTPDSATCRRRLQRSVTSWLLESVGILHQMLPPARAQQAVLHSALTNSFACERLPEV